MFVYQISIDYTRVPILRQDSFRRNELIISNFAKHFTPTQPLPLQWSSCKSLATKRF